MWRKCHGGIGKEVGNENISSASRMNKALVGFVKEENQVRHLTNTDIVELDMSFRVVYEGRSYTVYTSTGHMKCFECGDVGGCWRLAYPHRPLRGQLGRVTWWKLGRVMKGQLGRITWWV
ncbi:ice nucleation protein-like [Tachysurus ichikawai]